MAHDFHLRPVAAADQTFCEHLIRDAFWDLYRPGCHEHYLWHLAAQGHPDVVDEFTMVAVMGQDVVGCIMSTRARLVTAAGKLEVLAPGPVAVAPRYQDHGIGTALMNATLDAARATGFPAAFLYGDPHYYPRFGFHDAKHLDVTTTEGDNFPEFMGLELIDDALAGGKLVESSLFDVDPVEVDAFDAGFPARSKRQRSSLT